MAIVTKVETSFGEERELYVRLNNVSASNHGVEGLALFRGFLNKEAYQNNKHFLYEEAINFKVDVSLPIWEQAYSEIKLKYPEHIEA